MALRQAKKPWHFSDGPYRRLTLLSSVTNGRARWTSYFFHCSHGSGVRKVGCRKSTHSDISLKDIIAGLWLLVKQFFHSFFVAVCSLKLRAEAWTTSNANTAVIATAKHFIFRKRHAWRLNIVNTDIDIRIIEWTFVKTYLVLKEILQCRNNHHFPLFNIIRITIM